MNLLRTSLLAVVLCFAMASCSKDDVNESPETNYSVDLSLANKTNWQLANEVLSLINDHRATLNLAPIVMDKRLATAHAVVHSEYMIAQDELSHDNYAQRSQALMQSGAQQVGENVALGYDSARDVVTAWLNSPSHKRVIEGDYSHSGFGIIQDYRGTFYFTHLFYLE